MCTLSDLHRAVRTTLAEKRIGRPVFVRYTASTTPQAAIGKLAALTDVVRGWLGQPLDQVYAQGAAEGGSLTVTLQFRGGATALVSLVPHLPGEASVDLMILGNHGAIYHDAACAERWDDDAADTAAPEALRSVIQRALASGKPEPVTAEAER